MKNKLQSLGRSLLLDGKLRSKLLYIFFLLVLLPLGIFTMYAFHRINTVIEKQTFSAAQKAFVDTQTAVDDLFDRLSQVVDILAMDPNVYELAGSSLENSTYIQRLQDSNQLAMTFHYLRSLSGVDRICMYVNNDYLYTNTSDIVDLHSVEDRQWLKAFSPETPTRWFAPGDFSDEPLERDRCYSLMRMIYDPSHVLQPLAILRVDIAADRVAEAVGRSTITENGMVFLLHDNRILTSSSETELPSVFWENIEVNPRLPGGWSDLKTQWGTFHTQYVSLGNSGWILGAALPHDDIFRVSREIQMELLAVVVILALAAYLLAYLISRSILRRLLRLNDTMHAVEQGNISTRLEPVGEDEIGQLMQSFSNMMNRIDTLMDEKLAQGQQIKALELKALQAQINPHFLYNSLDLINCTAIVHNVPQISTMVNALAQFYRLSLSRGREVIPLSDELRHARLYVQIQNMRFENRVHVQWDIEQETLPYPIIKIVLQPIIENAIIHGIFEKPDKTGSLCISTRYMGQTIRITVEDDGVGMDPATLEANFGAAYSAADTKGGYGVRNINERLRLAYGPSYGMQCESTPGKGTKVTITIPCQ